MLAAAGGLVAYLRHVGRGTLPMLLPPVAIEGSGTLAMDAATRASLEIVEASRGGRKGSLIDAVDRCALARRRDFDDPPAERPSRPPPALTTGRGSS